MKVYYPEQFDVPLPVGHRFPIEKYAMLHKKVKEYQQLNSFDLCEAPAASDAQISQVHTKDYLYRILNGELSDREIRRIGFPWSLDLVRRARQTVGGTIAACQAAIQEGYAANLAGGTHHAHADHGAGFCVFNDVAIAARTMQAEGDIERVVILDCDVHQGDGTAAVFHSDPSVFTFSIHGAKNFPHRKVPGDLDIELADGCDDGTYLSALQAGIRCALEAFQADLAIFIAGADPYEHDRLGRLAVTKMGLSKRDSYVIDMCREFKLPIAVVMGGGYSNLVEDTVDIYMETIQVLIKASICKNW